MGDVARYTRADVATRNGRGSAPLWLIIRDSVYDVTNYANEHPGGDDVLVEKAGKDATSEFDFGHSSDAKKILTKYKVGEIVEEEKHYDENGKKKKKKVVSAPTDTTNRGCLSIVTCGLIG